MIVKRGRRTFRCHCPTTGRLGSLRLEGLPCLLSETTKAERRTRFTVEAISVTNGDSWIGINQTAANRYLESFLRAGSLSKIASGEVKREVKVGGSRIDFRVGETLIEVKTPLIALPSPAGETAKRTSRFDSFERLIRHMNDLVQALDAGMKAAIVLCYMYDAEPFTPPPRDKTNSRIIEAARGAEIAGVKRWQVNLRIDEDGVGLIRYFERRPYAS